MPIRYSSDSLRIHILLPSRVYIIAIESVHYCHRECTLLLSRVYIIDHMSLSYSYPTYILIRRCPESNAVCEVSFYVFLHELMCGFILFQLNVAFKSKINRMFAN